ncbi:MAG: VWA domain-containing protein [Acidobacteria bacterium]|nr:VWA domain-containing protein [Acidobacteriota bacterium]
MERSQARIVQASIAAVAVAASIASWAEASQAEPSREAAPPPRASVRIVAPAASEVVYGTLVMKAAVIPPTGVSVVHVDFFADGLLLASDPLPPYTAAWDAGKSLSSHLFRVVARFADGTSAEDLVTTRGLSMEHHELVEGTAIERLQILVSVADASGSPVKGLLASDFSVREGDAPVKVTSLGSVSASSDIPLSLAILVDRSGSMQFHMKQWGAACVDLLSAVRPIDQVRVSVFSDETTVLQDFTHDAASLSASLAGVIPSGGSTSLFRAVFETVRDMRDLPGRKALILMTDGLDTDFGGSSQPITAAMFPVLNEAARMAIRSGVTILLILPGPSGRGYLAVQDLALQTGGWYMYPSQDLRALMKRLGERLLSAYVLEYDVARPRDADRKRPIKVTLTGDHPGLEIRTSLGTYARLDANEELKRDLRDGNRQQRARAAREMGLSGGGPEVVADLIKALRSDFPEVRAAAAAALGSRREPDALGKVLKLIHDSDADVRAAAFEAAVRYGAAALPSLTDLAQHGGPARASALRALGDIGDPAAMEVLSAGMREKDCELRAAAADGLGWMAALNRGERVTADILSRALDDRCPEAREASAISLARLADRIALPALLEIATAAPGSPRIPDVLRALAGYPTKASVDTVEIFLTAPEPARSAARESAAALYGFSFRNGGPVPREESLRRLVALGGHEALIAVDALLAPQGSGGAEGAEWRARLESARAAIAGG